MGGAHGTPTAQDPGGLPVLPRHHPRAASAAARVVVTGERCAVKAACAVRAGGRRKRTRYGGHLAGGLPAPRASLTCPGGRRGRGRGGAAPPITPATGWPGQPHRGG